MPFSLLNRGPNTKAALYSPCPDDTLGIRHRFAWDGKPPRRPFLIPVAIN